MKESRVIRHLSKKETIDLAISTVIYLALVVLYYIFSYNSAGELVIFVVTGVYLSYAITMTKTSKIWEVLVVSAVLLWGTVAYFSDPILKPYLDKFLSINTVNSSTTWINILIAVSFLISYIINRIIWKNRSY